MTAFEKKSFDKILIVDDDNLIRKCMKSMMQTIKVELNLGFDIIEGCDGNDIVNYCSDNKNSEFMKIVFTDEQMKEMNGSDAIKNVRNFEKVKQKSKNHFVSITSESNEKTINKIFDSGADYVLNKPLTKNQLRKVIVEILNQEMANKVCLIN